MKMLVAVLYWAENKDPQSQWMWACSRHETEAIRLGTVWA
jgi:hypothetical protein